MKKFSISLVLAFMVIFSFSACDSTRAKQQTVDDSISNNYNTSESYQQQDIEENDDKPLVYDISPPTVYEDGEDGETSRWAVWQGHAIANADIGADGSNHSIFVRHNWLYTDAGDSVLDENGFPINAAHYQLDMYNDHQFILELDKMKKGGYNGNNYCFSMGVKLATNYGVRYITFNPYYERESIEQSEQYIMNGEVKELTFPLSMSYVLDTGVWQHLRFDLNNYLHQFEPNNQITEVLSFYFQGGDDYLDNIRLLSE